MTSLSEYASVGDNSSITTEDAFDEQAYLFGVLLDKFGLKGYPVSLVGKYGADRYYFMIDDVVILVSVRYLTSDAIGRVRNVRFPVYICSLLAFDKFETSLSIFLLGQLHELSVERIINTFRTNGTQHSVRGADVVQLLKIDNSKAA